MATNIGLLMSHIHTGYFVRTQTDTFYHQLSCTQYNDKGKCYSWKDSRYALPEQQPPPVAEDCKSAFFLRQSSVCSVADHPACCKFQPSFNVILSFVVRCFPCCMTSSDSLCYTVSDTHWSMYVIAVHILTNVGHCLRKHCRVYPHHRN